MNNGYFDPNDPTNYWVLQANSRANKAEFYENIAKEELAAEKFNNRANIDLIIKLRNKATFEAERANKLSQIVNELKEDKIKLESEKQFFENLLSLPMKEIAQKNEQFKKTYETQQYILAKWILSQKAYAETAMQIGIEAGKTTEEIENIYRENIALVLANATKYGNNAETNQTLNENAIKIIKNNKPKSSS
jgi:hypothetical protein